ncbi:MAG: SDR family oxidoreductase [Deltaproteobacteria bacterium]|nr:SDR family oxidoreductase [Deltaproteobacteria bacterium]
MTNKKNALIIGGGSGMGRAAAEALLHEGYRVHAADLSREACREWIDALGARDEDARAYHVDISSSASVTALFSTIKKQAQRLDLMVHAAGILGNTAFIEDMGDDEWRRMMGVNLDGVFFCCREAVRWMKTCESGRIILFSSVAALTPTPGALHYSAAKGGVNMLGRTLAKEVARHNIQVNIIAPGYIETPMLKQMPEGFLKHILKNTPQGRLGTPVEIAALVSFLASDEAGFFTGQVFSPNGGLVI